jgi:hypothetical protein
MGYRDVARADILAVIEEAKAVSESAGYTPWKNAIEIFHTVLALDFSAEATELQEQPFSRTKP